jgi:hypothetical protein
MLIKHFLSARQLCTNFIARVCVCVCVCVCVLVCLEAESCCVAHAGLLSSSRDPPASASRVDVTSGVCHHAQLFQII